MAPRAYTNYKWHIIGNFYRQHNLTGLTKLTDSQWTTLHARTPWWPTGSPAEKHKLETSAKNHIVPTELAVLQVDDEGEVEWHPDTPVLREPADVRDRGPAPAFKPWKSLPPISEENVTPAAAAAAAAASTHSKGRNAGLDAETEEGDSQEPSGQQELSNHTLQALAGTKSGEREESVGHGVDAVPSTLQHEVSGGNREQQQPQLNVQRQEEATLAFDVEEQGWVEDQLRLEESEPPTAASKTQQLQDQLQSKQTILTSKALEQRRLRNQLSTAATDDQQLQDQLQSKEATLTSKALEQRRLRNQLSTAATDDQQLQDQLQSIEATLTSKALEQRRLRNQLSTAATDDQQLQDQLRTATTENQRLRHQHELMERRIRSLQEERDQAMADARAIWAAYVEMEERVGAERMYGTGGKAVR